MRQASTKFSFFLGPTPEQSPSLLSFSKVPQPSMPPCTISLKEIWGCRIYWSLHLIMPSIIYFLPCIFWDHICLSRDQTWATAVKARNPNHRATSEVPTLPYSCLLTFRSLRGELSLSVSWKQVASKQLAEQSTRRRRSREDSRPSQTARSSRSGHRADVQMELSAVETQREILLFLLSTGFPGAVCLVAMAWAVRFHNSPPACHVLHQQCEFNQPRQSVGFCPCEWNKTFLTS